MPHAIADHEKIRTALLAAALANTVAELRLIDTADIVAFMRSGRWANIADLVDSSAELSFAEGTLAFACAGAVRGGGASVSLELEFQHGPVTAFFTLTLAPTATHIEIRTLWFALDPVDVVTETRLFEAALVAARARPQR